MKRLILISAVVVLAGCGKAGPRAEVYNQCLRVQLFQQCMAGLPKGPERVGAASNDWDEVISECGSQARYLSVRPRAAVPTECLLETM